MKKSSGLCNWSRQLKPGSDNYENIVYGLAAGEASVPFRTKTGWHVVKNAEERKSIGKLKVAQILFALPQNASAETVKAARQKADSIYKLLQAGQDFATLAKKFSDDKNCISQNQ